MKPGLKESGFFCSTIYYSAGNCQSPAEYNNEIVRVSLKVKPSLKFIRLFHYTGNVVSL